MQNRALAAIAAAVAFAAPLAHADVLWDEAINGDLSSDNLSPNSFALLPGSNTVFGTTVAEPELDPDFFTLTVPAGFEISSVVFVRYQSGDDQAFFAIELGGQVTDTGSPVSLLTAALIGGVEGSGEGDELLDDLQNGNVWGGFEGNLGAGDYTFWYQETAAATSYGFDFVVTPVPAPASASLLAVGGLALVRRRR